MHCDDMNYILFHYRQVHILAHRETSYPKFEEHIGIYIYDVELDSWNVKYFQYCNLGIKYNNFLINRNIVEMKLCF